MDDVGVGAGLGELQGAEAGDLAHLGLDGAERLAGGLAVGAGLVQLEGEPLAGLGGRAAVDGLVDADRGLAGGLVGVREGHLELAGGYQLPALIGLPVHHLANEPAIFLDNLDLGRIRCGIECPAIWSDAALTNDIGECLTSHAVRQSTDELVVGVYHVTGGKSSDRDIVQYRSRRGILSRGLGMKCECGPLRCGYALNGFLYIQLKRPRR